MRKVLLFSMLALLLFSCKQENNVADAYGNFETEEKLFSSEASGRLINFEVEEGQELKKGDTLGYVDSLQLYLKKKQINASIDAIYAQLPDIAIQLKVIEEKIEVAQKEEKRFQILVDSGAVKEKQLDDIRAEIKVMHRQLASLESQLNTKSKSMLANVKPLKMQIEQMDDQLRRCILINQIDGVVLKKYVYEGEMISAGKPLFKVGNLKQIILRAYLSETQLSAVKLGQQMKVSIDTKEEKMKTFDGELFWISQQSEFTPKIIQTKEERVNLVYAIKIKVENDGSIKIGMPAEVQF